MEADSHNLLSFESCRSSVVDYIEEMSPESPRKSPYVQVVMSETAGKATRGRGEDGWRLEPEGETETLETIVFLGTRWKASSDTPTAKVSM